MFDGEPGAPTTAVHEGLYVSDGAVIPALDRRQLTFFTITALTERTLLHMAQDHGLAFDAAPLSGIRATPQDLSPFLAA